MVVLNCREYDLEAFGRQSVAKLPPCDSAQLVTLARQDPTEPHADPTLRGCKIHTRSVMLLWPAQKRPTGSSVVAERNGILHLTSDWSEQSALRRFPTLGEGPRHSPALML